MLISGMGIYFLTKLGVNGSLCPITTYKTTSGTYLARFNE